MPEVTPTISRTEKATSSFLPTSSSPHKMKFFELPSIPGSSRIRGWSLTAFCAFVCASGFLLFGYDQGVMSLLITEPMLATSMPKIASYSPNGPDQEEDYAKHNDDPVEYLSLIHI